MHKHSFVVTITTNERVGSNTIAKLLRAVLVTQRIWQGLPCGRKAIKVTKATVIPVGEK